MNWTLYYPTGSAGWLLVNFAYDILMGFGLYLFMVYALPRLQRASRTFTYIGKDGRDHKRPIHPKWFAFYAYLTIIVLMIPLWAEFATLLFSMGWKNPFLTTDWFGIRVPGWLFDFAYARANDLPSGAHLLSYIGVPVFGLVVTYKFAKGGGMNRLIGDPFQGLSAEVFMGGVHELIWIVFYYTAYWPYLNWSLLSEVVRDVSFVSMTIFLVVTFWKMPTRKIPLKIFKWPVVLFTAYCAAWFVVPPLLGGPVFPITTINNPQFGIGFYQETPWFPLLYVNALEVGSWLLLWVSFVIQVVRYKAD
jgi:hypothetical protein